MCFRYLINHQANVAAVNNDGDLPMDIADSTHVENLLQQEMDKQGDSVFLLFFSWFQQPLCAMRLRREGEEEDFYISHLEVISLFIELTPYTLISH